MLPFRHVLLYTLVSLSFATLLSAEEPKKAPPAHLVYVFNVTAPQ
jgi:hypothetical protein